MRAGSGASGARGGAGRRRPRPGRREERGPRPGLPGPSGPRSRRSSCQCPGASGDGAAAWRSRTGLRGGGCGSRSCMELSLRDRPCPGRAVLRLPRGRLEALRCRAGPGVASGVAPRESHRGERAATKGSGSREALPSERRPWKRALGSPLSRNNSEGRGVS